MKVRNSLKSAKIRDKDCRVVRRKGRVYVINKKNPRFKVREGRETHKRKTENRASARFFVAWTYPDTKCVQSGTKD